MNRSTPRQPLSLRAVLGRGGSLFEAANWIEYATARTGDPPGMRGEGVVSGAWLKH